jgi:hypothetical protein
VLTRSWQCLDQSSLEYGVRSIDFLRTPQAPFLLYVVCVGWFPGQARRIIKQSRVSFQGCWCPYVSAGPLEVLWHAPPRNFNPIIRHAGIHIDFCYKPLFVIRPYDQWSASLGQVLRTSVAYFHSLALKSKGCRYPEETYIQQRSAHSAALLT